MSNKPNIPPKDSISLEEQETVINYSPAERKTATIYTSSQRDLRRLWKIYEQHPDEVQIVRDDKYGTEFRIPESWIRIRPKKEISEERRIAAAEQLAAIRAARANAAKS